METTLKFHLYSKTSFISVLLLLTASLSAQTNTEKQTAEYSTSYTGPIIDMHLHFYTSDDFWGPTGNTSVASWSPNPTQIKGEPLRLDRVGPRWNPDKKELLEITGSFFSEELDATWKIVVNDEGLILKRWGIEDQYLDSLNKDVFAFKGNTSPRLEFLRGSDGRINQMEVSNEQILGIKFLKRE